MQQHTDFSYLQHFASHQLTETIMPFWRKYMPDEENKGFYGQINLDLTPELSAEKGLVLNARILWTFSAVYQKLRNPEDKQLADRAYQYLKDFFYDKTNQGYYWSLKANGTPNDTKKQIYAEAFVIYGLSEYYKINPDPKILEEAIQVYHLIEKHSFDNQKNGYIEACTREWKELADLRLSAKDMNEKKSMNTHLHILEAYANLYRIWPDNELANKLENLIYIFKNKIINASDFHLDLFFDENWNSKASVYSYGHDIEASWLIHEAAVVLGKKEVIADIETICVKVADAALQGFRPEGALVYEDDRQNKHTDYQIEWWPQAEGIVGCLNTYLLTNNSKYLDIANQLAKFIDNNIVDKTNGEWYFRVNLDGSPVIKYEKAGFWKCPYHNTRACLETLHRISEFNAKG